MGPAQRPEQLRAGVEANLRSLEVAQVDVVNLRLHSDAHDSEGNSGEVDLDSQLAEMVALRDEGKIGAIGLSNVSLDQLRQAMPAGLACVQNAYSLLDRSSEPLLELCRDARHGLGAVFPPRLGVPRDAEGDPAPGCGGRGNGPGGDTRPGGAGLATGP